jgi:hypothetical protein
VRSEFLGDSFDIVKRFWAEQLAPVGPLLAHPRFVPKSIRTEFEQITQIRVLDGDGAPDRAYGLFLDPGTGIPLPSSANQTASVSHAPLGFLAAELRRFRPRYVICFDQSLYRSSGHSKEMQRQTKLAALGAEGIPCMLRFSSRRRARRILNLYADD